MSKVEKGSPGPDPERLKLPEKDWEEAVEKALRKRKPKEGWPEDAGDGEGEKSQEDE